MKNLTFLLALLLSTSAISQTITHKNLLEKVRCKSNSCFAPLADSLGFVLEKTETVGEAKNYTYIAKKPTASSTIEGMAEKDRIELSINPNGLSFISIVSVGNLYYENTIKPATDFLSMGRGLDEEGNLVTRYKSKQNPGYIYMYMKSKGINKNGVEYPIITIVMAYTNQP